MMSTMHGIENVIYPLLPNPFTYVHILHILEALLAKMDAPSYIFTCMQANRKPEALLLGQKRVSITSSMNDR